MSNVFIPADLFIADSAREKQFLKMSISGPTKAGKTYTSLRLAFAIIRWLKENPSNIPDGSQPTVMAIDTERGRMSLYDGQVEDGSTWKWKKINLPPPYTIERFQGAVALALQNKPAVLIIDSLSHEWEGEGGALQAQRAAGGRYQDWDKITPAHQKLIDMILAAECHTLVTMRSKMDHAMEEYEENGRRKTRVQRIGLAPVQRNNVPYEFDFELEIDQEGFGQMKARYKLMQGWAGHHPGPSIIPPIMEWLVDGAVPSWLPSYPEFVAAIKEQCPELCKDLSGRELGQHLSQLLQGKFSMAGGWNPSVADEAKAYLIEIEKQEMAKPQGTPAAPAKVEAPAPPEQQAPEAAEPPKNGRKPWPLTQQGQNKITEKLQEIGAPHRAFFDSFGVKNWEELAESKNLLAAKNSWEQFKIFWESNKDKYLGALPEAVAAVMAAAVTKSLEEDEIPF